MSFKRGFSLLLALLSTQMGIQANQYADCNCGCWCDGLWADVDFLFWKTTLSNSEVAAVSTLSVSSGTNERVFLSYDWQPGVRATLAKDNLWCGWNLLGRYTYIQPQGSVNLNADSANIGIFSIYLAANYGTAVANFEYSGPTTNALFQRERITYQTWEVLFSKSTFENCYLTLLPYFGVEGLLCDQKLLVSVVGDNGAASFNTTLDFHGTGLKTGLNASLPLWNCFNFFVDPSLALVYGTKRWRVESSGTTNGDTPNL